jgi:hypothetical protein
MAPQPPLPASAIPGRKATPARVVWTVLAIGLLIPFVVFLLSGALLATAFAVVPLAIIVFAVAANRPRRDSTGDDRDTGLDANPAGSGAARPGPRGGTYQ